MTTITDAHREAKRRIEQVGIKAEHHPSLWNLIAQALAEPAWTPPVDPDLIEARECAALAYEAMNEPRWARDCRDGANDHGGAVQSARIAIKRSKA